MKKLVVPVFKSQAWIVLPYNTSIVRALSLLLFPL